MRVAPTASEVGGRASAHSGTALRSPTAARSHRMLLAGVFALIAMIASAPAVAELFYAVNTVDDGLSIIDTDTALVAFIGELGPDFKLPVAMAIRPSDGKIFIWDNETGGLATVDECGAATSVSSGIGVNIGALAFTPDGALYGFGQGLRKIDDSTGELTFIGGGGPLIYGMTSDANGTLFAIEGFSNESLVTIDRDTGAASEVGPTTLPANTLGSIAFDASGNLIGSAFRAGLNQPFYLFDIDHTSGETSNERLISGGTVPQGMGLVHSSLTVSTSIDGAAVAAVLSGDGVTIDADSVEYTGARRASGMFSTTQESTFPESELGLSEGVILTSGHALLSLGPNCLPNSLGRNFLAGDADLEELFPNTLTTDASSLIFKFEAASAGELSFEYVFASEEYNEVAAEDPFALFLDGENLALVPGMPTTYVGVDTVNASTNSEFFRDNDGTGLLDLEYDGATTVLTARVAVTAGEHIMKLVVADTFDFDYDTAIFIAPIKIPEPGLLPLQIAALGVLFLLSRRSRRARCPPAA